MKYSMEFYKMAECQKAGTEVTFKGVPNVMQDNKNFVAFLQSLTSGDAAVTMQFHCDRKNFFMDGCNAFLQWTASIPACNATLTGVIRCVFSPASNKLISCSMTFDSGVLISLLRNKNNFTIATEDSAAEAAASEADAILDSLQMPRLMPLIMV